MMESRSRACTNIRLERATKARELLAGGGSGAGAQPLGRVRVRVRVRVPVTVASPRQRRVSELSA